MMRAPLEKDGDVAPGGTDTQNVTGRDVIECLRNKNRSCGIGNIVIVWRVRAVWQHIPCKTLRYFTVARNKPLRLSKGHWSIFVVS